MTPRSIRSRGALLNTSKTTEPMQKKHTPRKPFGALALTLALAGVVAFSHAPLAHAADDALKALIDQGKYWQAHGRGDLAEQAWEKVLRLDAKQPDALLGMGMVMADRKDGGRAESYLDARSRRTIPVSTIWAAASGNRARATRP